MVKKVKAKVEGFTKVNVKKDWKDIRSLLVVDVSAVMRTNYTPMETSEQYFSGGGFFGKREALTYEVNGETINTSALFGLFSIFKKFGTYHDFVFCYDTPSKNLLKNIDVNYKANRVKMGNEYYDQVNTALKILEEVGFTSMYEAGYEGDHMVHEAVVENYNNYDKIGVLTNDHDLSCLVDEKVDWINTLTTRSDIVRANYELLNKCPYNAILLKKSLVGDNSDNIKGVKGFGEKAFEKFLITEKLDGVEIYGSEEEIIKNSELTPEKKEQALLALNLVYPLEVHVEAKVKKDIDIGKLKAFLSKYGMESINTLWEVEEW